MGANGAGKSTLLKLVSGILRPDTGRIEVRGRVGSLIEIGAGFHPLLTGRENIYINGAILGMSRREIERKFDSIVEFAEIGDFLDSPVKFYSSGMYVRLGFAVAAHTEPDLLIVDEVLAVGDLSFRMRCFRRVRELRESGTAILVVSHNHADLARVAQRALVLDRGAEHFRGGIREGTTRYRELLLRDRARPTGDRPCSPARIEHATFVDRHGRPRSAFRTGEDIALDIEIESSAPVKDARLVVKIENPEGAILGAFSSAWSDFFIDLSPPGTRVRLVLRDAPLLLGSYGVHVSLYGAGAEDVLDRVRDLTRIRVDGPELGPVGFGVAESVLFAHHWERPSEAREGPMT
jgi:lipopolysaccharide transport system ATP-binding protein